MIWAAVAGAFLLASFIKGTTGMGFPLIATPMVAMLVDVRTAYALLLLPNIMMDVLQIARSEISWHLWRRLAPFFATTVVGVIVGTRILVAIPERAIFFCLAGMIIVYLLSVRLRVALRMPERYEPLIGSLAGLAAGVLTGVTNAIGPLAAFYVLSLELEKREFVRAVASIFLVAKLSQLAAAAHWGFFTWSIVRWSAALSLLALGAFWLGLAAQDRVRQETFLRILYVLLFAMALLFISRGLHAR